MSKLSLLKVLNAARVYSSFILSKWTKKPIQWGAPFNVSIEPTTSCNLGCPECPSGLRSFSRPTGRLDVKLYQSILDQLSDTLIYLYFYFQGEPYLHPNFLELVKEASGKNIYTVTSTNGHFLSKRKAIETVESGLSRIIISIDGTTQEVYEQYRRNGSLDKVITGARNLVEAKKELNSKTPHIIFQFLVVKPNEHQIAEVEKLTAEIGVDELTLKTAQIYDYEKGNELIPSIDQYSRYKKQKDGSYKIKNPMLNHCWKLWHSCVLTWDGKVVPCCFDKDAKYQLGDLNTSTFKTIWKNEKYYAFRQSVLRSRSEIDICTNCTEGTKVWAES
ncbi:MAG: radical SAM protein [Chitinophagales bacterium]|nr:radical SAM protein [Chitinophagales bacterium]